MPSDFLKPPFVLRRRLSNPQPPSAAGMVVSPQHDTIVYQSCLLLILNAQLENKPMQDAVRACPFCQRFPLPSHARGGVVWCGLAWCALVLCGTSRTVWLSNIGKVHSFLSAGGAFWHAFSCLLQSSLFPPQPCVAGKC